MAKGKASLGGQINTWVLRVFVLFWGLFIWLDYSYHSSYYAHAIHNFPQWAMFFLLLLLPAFYALVRRKNSKLNSHFELKGIAGWHLVAGGLAIQVITAGIAASQAGLHDGGGIERLGYFLVFSLGQLILLALIVICAYSLGSFLQGLIPANVSGSGRILGSVAMGFAVLTLLLFILGVLSLLTTYAVGIALLLTLALGWRRGVDVFREVVLRKGRPVQIHPVFLWVGLILITFIAMNLVAMNRPMPLGFDAMNLYANKPNLLAQYGALTQGGQAYNWSLIMSLGFVLIDSTSLGLLLSVVPGILSVFVVFRLARLVFTSGWALLAATLFYTLPLVTWQSTQEAKVDLALLFILLTALLIWLEASIKSKMADNKAKPGKSSLKGLVAWAKQHPQGALWIVIGILMGYGLGIKYTTVFAIVAFMVMALRERYGAQGYWAGYLGGFAFLFGLGVYRFSSIDIRIATAAIIFVLGLAGAVTLLIIARRKAGKPGLMPVGRVWGLMLGMAMLVFAPWVVKNVSEAKSISVGAVLNGKSSLPPVHDVEFQNPDVSFEPTQPEWVPPDQIVQYAQGDVREDLGDPLSPQKRRVKSGVYEEMSRYIGYEKGVMRFLSLPYDLTMRTNVNNYAVDISFLFLFFLPLLMLVPRPKQLKWNILRIGILILWLGASYYSVWFNHGADATTHQSQISQQIESHAPFWIGGVESIYQAFAGSLYGVGQRLEILLTAPVITSERFVLLFAVASVFGVFLLFWGFMRALNHKEKRIAAFLVIYGMIWFVFGSGIVWYGIVLLAMAGVLIILGFGKPDRLFADPLIRYIGIAFIGIWLLSTMMLRIAHTNPIEDPSFRVYDPVFLEYQLGISTAGEAVEKKTSIYTPALRVINQNTEGRVLRAGTFMNYFIKENDRRVYIDNQLNLFDYLSSLGETKEEVAEKMKEAGIRYLVFAFNTGADDATPEKSVQAKAQAFYQFVFNNPNVRLIYTDRLMADPEGQEVVTRNGQQIRVSHQVFGRTEQVVEPGTYAAFEVL